MAMKFLGPGIILSLIFCSVGFAQQDSTVAGAMQSEEIKPPEAPASAATSSPIPVVAPTATSATTPAPVVVSETPPANEKMDALQAQIDSLQKQFKDMKAKEIAPTPVVVAPAATTVAPVVPVANQPLIATPTTTPPAPAVSPSRKTDLDLLTQEPTHQLRKRAQVLSWFYDYQYAKITDKSSGGSGASADANISKMGIEYAHNFSFWEGGVYLTSTNISDSDVKETLTGFGVLARLNFIENKPGHDFIPYVAGYLGVLGLTEDTGTNTYQLSGGNAGLGLGFNWFPFSEIFALNLELKAMSGDIENDGTPKLQLEVKQSILQVGWKIYF